MTQSDVKDPRRNLVSSPSDTPYRRREQPTDASGQTGRDCISSDHDREEAKRKKDLSSRFLAVNSFSSNNLWWCGVACAQSISDGQLKVSNRTTFFSWIVKWAAVFSRPEFDRIKTTVDWNGKESHWASVGRYHFVHNCHRQELTFIKIVESHAVRGATLVIDTPTLSLLAM